MKALLVLFLAGCALLQPPPKPPAPRPSLGEKLAALSIGVSTKSDARSALGEATVVDFASGYEVWVYREETPARELVLLFEPSGVLAKSRLTPP